MTSNEQKKKEKNCMASIQLALCMQLGTLVFTLAICIQPLSCLKKPLSSWSHNMNAVLSPAFFGVVGGGAGVRARRWEKC